MSQASCQRLLEQMSQVTELEDLLGLLSQALESTGAFAGFLVNLIDADDEALGCRWAQLPPSHSRMRQVYRDFRFGLDSDDPNLTCYRERSSRLFDADSIQAVRGVVRTAFERWHASALLILPITVDGKSIGTLMAFRETGAIADEARAEAERLLGFFSKRLAHALTYDRLQAIEEAAAAALDEKQQFLEFVAKINKLSELDSIYDEIAHKFLGKYGFDVASFALREGEFLHVQQFVGSRPEWAERCRRLTELNREPVPLEHSECASCFAYLQDMRIHLPDAAALTDLPMAERDRRSLDVMGKVRTVLHLPIRHNDEPIGMLGLYSLLQPVKLSDSDLRLIELFCGFLGTAISNAKLYQLAADQGAEIAELNRELEGKIERLNEMVSKDQLTGLNNFGAFEAELQRRTSEYSRQSPNVALSLVIIDVDHFKRFNDTYGHVAGNYVLQEVARRIATVARKMDIPCRYGGEEFVVILPKCKLDGAEVFAERVREAIADEPFFAEDHVVSVTISAGCASYIAGEDAENLLARADAALYRAKENGRNRVERADPAPTDLPA